MPGKRYVVRLTEDERSTLTKVIRAEKGVPPKKRMRAQILLKVDQGEHGPGWTDDQTARALDVHVNSPPRGRSRWTLHLLADRMVELEIFEKVSHEAVRKVLKKTRSTLTDRWRG